MTATLRTVITSAAPGHFDPAQHSLARLPGSGRAASPDRPYAQGWFYPLSRRIVHCRRCS